MNEEKQVTLSEAASNIVENLACRIAERTGGKITPNHLLPYLAMSLDLISSCLDSMVDDTSVFKEIEQDIVTYEFVVYSHRDTSSGKSVNSGDCLSCGVDLASRGGRVLCANCTKILQKELNRLAERIGWPAQAVYEHEILYLASSRKGAIHAEDLAGRSRYTLRRIRQKLNKLSLSGYIRQEIDPEAGVMNYIFPKIEYSKAMYRENMAVITKYPASVMEEVLLKITRILFALSVLIIGLFVLAFMHVPFRYLILAFLVLAPLFTLTVWFKRSRPIDE